MLTSVKLPACLGRYDSSILHALQTGPPVIEKRKRISLDLYSDTSTLPDQLNHMSLVMRNMVGLLQYKEKTYLILIHSAHGTQDEQTEVVLAYGLDYAMFLDQSTTIYTYITLIAPDSTLKQPKMLPLSPYMTEKNQNGKLYYSESSPKDFFYVMPKR